MTALAGDRSPAPPGFHIPGLTPHPDDGPAHRAAAAAPRTEAAGWRDNAAYLYGFDLYAGGFFWEAHEVWEAVWMTAAPNSREKALMQALIQTTNACLKVAMGRRGAAVKLARLAEAKFAEAALGGGRVMGVDCARAARVLAGFGGAMEADGRPGWALRAHGARPDLAPEKHAL